MLHVLSRRVLTSIVLTSIVGFGFVACNVDEFGTATVPPGSTSTSNSSSTSSGMGGEAGSSSSSSSSSGMAGMGGSGGGSSSSSSGVSSGGLGADCMLPSDCSSGFCEDDVCCSASCGPCQSCNQANSKGTCTFVSEGTDDCSMDGQLCSKLGQCECGVSVPAVADGACPADPKWSSPSAGVCLYTCDQMDECKNKPTVTCAAGSDCVIDCTANGSCEGTTFVCPPGHKCTMNCPTTDSCKNSTLNCNDNAPCHVECGGVGGNSCNMTVNCGFNSCTTNCDGAGKPNMIPKPGTVCEAKQCQ